MAGGNRALIPRQMTARQTSRQLFTDGNEKVSPVNPR